MVLFGFIFIATLILAVVLLRRPPERSETRSRLARWMLFGALLLMGLHTAFWLSFTVGEVIGGDVSGLSHLPPALILITLMALAYRRPREAGVFLVIVGTAASVFFSAATHGGKGFQLQAVLLGGVPFLLAGLLLLAASLLPRSS
jgi:hypothetical protein